MWPTNANDYVLKGIIGRVLGLGMKSWIGGICKGVQGRMQDKWQDCGD